MRIHFPRAFLNSPTLWSKLQFQLGFGAPTDTYRELRNNHPKITTIRLIIADDQLHLVVVIP